MSLAIFDLDNTLLGGDSDYLWGQFLVDQGIVDKLSYETTNRRFYEDYRAGTLDIFEFLEFALSPLAANEPEDLFRWREDFIDARIRPIILPAATELVDRHRAAGDTLVVITATNQFITEPITALYGIEHLIATRPEFSEGRYTGHVVGTPCFQSGKVERLKLWLEQTGHNLENSWFYSDSCNDLPLLRQVDQPVAVDPDEILEQVALAEGWPILTLRNRSCPAEHLEKVS